MDDDEWITIPRMEMGGPIVGWGERVYPEPREVDDAEAGNQ